MNVRVTGYKGGEKNESIFLKSSMAERYYLEMMLPEGNNLLHYYLY